MAKILIIEDTENNRVLLTRRLKPRGHDIVKTRSTVWRWWRPSVPT